VDGTGGRRSGRPRAAPAGQARPGRDRFRIASDGDTVRGMAVLSVAVGIALAA
jgi:hypothetical protein